MCNLATTVAARLLSQPDGDWLAIVTEPDKGPTRLIGSQTGRARSREGALAAALKRGRVTYASAKDEQQIAVAAYRQRQMTLRTTGREVSFVSLR